MKEAMLYRKTDGERTDCFLCSHRCSIQKGGRGICGVRRNIDGVLYTQAYGKAAALGVDPIEKKPLFHFFPGSLSFSVASAGCNFHCGFCQNWQISQKTEYDGLGNVYKEIQPEQIVEQALSLPRKCKSISYTYTEPTVFFEYAYDTARKAKDKGLYNVFVTNGYMTKDALKAINPYLDAANVDLKSFRDDTYREVCGARLEPVLESIRTMRELDIWVEVTTLIIPGMNDHKDELTDIARFLADTGKDIPWHISRFHPDYKMNDVSATSIEKLNEARDIGIAAGLKYVYIGNVLDESPTCCYNCKEALIVRSGFSVAVNRIKNSKCPKCGEPVAGRFL